MIELGPNRYGTSAIRLVKVVRGAAGQQVRDLTISISLEGDGAADVAGVPTDTLKDTTYALAHEHLTGPIEHFGRVLAEHFVVLPQVVRATVAISEHAWTPIPTHAGPASDAFVRTDELTRTAQVQVTADGSTIEAGFQDLTLLKTASSGSGEGACLCEACRRREPIAADHGGFLRRVTNAPRPPLTGLLDSDVR